ncbi:MAG: hypothetical protein QOH86_1610 [Sphingomonadales bacterium]|jgi:hypothetical protein|nr:hypothetical protein [Sphingomonadales bacterium]
MQVSYFRIRQQLTEALLELPLVTDALERKQAGSVRQLIDLLQRAEQLLIENRMRQAADLAANRAALVAVGLDESGGRSRQRQRRCALERIGPIGAALAEALAPLEQRIESARLPARQLLQLIAASGAIVLNGDRDLTDLVERIWQLATEHDQLKSLATQIRVALNRQDIPLLLAEEIDLADFAA